MLAACLLVGLLPACGWRLPGRGPEPGPPGPKAVLVQSLPIRAAERYCAWYGDRRGDVLYFGQAPFWSSYRESGGDPRADLTRTGPQEVGRFLLSDESFLPPLTVAAEDASTGTWDVLAHPNGRVYFTTLFGSAGAIEAGSGRVLRFEAAGPGLNELALLPDGRLLVSRYGRAGQETGSVVILGEDGEVAAEYALGAPQPWRVAPKSVAFDAARNEIWVTTDLLSRAEEPPRHDARVLDAATGAERRRIADREVQFVEFAGDGRAALVERVDGSLALRLRPAGSEADPAESVPRILDPQFSADADYAQEVRFAADGTVIVTRWSGRVHLVGPDGRIESVQLPRPTPDGLYYTTVLRGRRLCATYCSDVTIVCASRP